MSPQPRSPKRADAGRYVVLIVEEDYWNRYMKKDHHAALDQAWTGPLTLEDQFVAPDIIHDAMEAEFPEDEEEEE